MATTTTDPARCRRCGSRNLTPAGCRACPVRVTLTPAGRDALAAVAAADRPHVRSGPAR